MGALIRSYDWDANELGPPADWPQALKTVVQLMLNTGHPMYIWWGANGICLYNDAYRQLIGSERHPGSLGQPAAEVWAEIWPIISPQIGLVMTTGSATWHENSLIPITRNGRRDDVYWTYSYSPIGDDDAPNGVGGVLVICNETTGQVMAERAVATAAKRQQHQFQSAPGFITVLTGPDHVFEFVNSAYTEVFGEREYIGRSVREVFPELTKQPFFDMLDCVYRTGEKLIVAETPISLMTDSDGGPHERFVTFVYAPIIDESGAVTGIFCEGMDVTAHHTAEEHRTLLTNELQHRVKNMLAVVQGIVGQSLRNVESPSDAREAIFSRLMALGHTHDLLTQTNWTEAPLSAIVEGAVLTHCVDRDQVRVAGPDIQLRARAALALSMTLHELFTNAVKHGSLSNEAGQVAITWSVSGTEAEGQTFALEWRESGGPVVAPPTRKGFGSRLVGTSLMPDLGGIGETEFAPYGVRWTLMTKLASIRY